MTRACVLIVGSFFLLAGFPARAVPGFAYYSHRFPVSVASCTAKVRQAVQSAVGAPPGNPTGDLSSWASVTSGFVSDTGVLVQCIANPETVCGVPSSNLFIFAFSDAGASRAVVIRQYVIAAFGDPSQPVDCGVGRNPVSE